MLFKTFFATSDGVILANERETKIERFIKNSSEQKFNVATYDLSPRRSLLVNPYTSNFRVTYLKSAEVLYVISKVSSPMIGKSSIILLVSVILKVPDTLDENKSSQMSICIRDFFRLSFFPTKLVKIKSLISISPALYTLSSFILKIHF